ncbi:hypothetical protein [Primorskyibacter sp. S187A]|uniref:hypothetical protein n=1 Tax=Primorskyibacter sp. S187A TaxID=3415130 RepID=UPI003C7A5010
MIRVLLCGAALAALAACQPAIPDSGAGVGFDRVDAERTARLNREAQLEGRSAAQPGLTAPATVAQQSLEDTAGAAARAQNSGQAPLDASPSNPAPRAVTNSAGISQEQDFNAVSDERGIQDDAARIAAARAQYVVIEPGALPTRPGTDVPNIVEYAIRTNNPVGASVYRRGGFNAQAKFVRNCAVYASPDQAQEDFLIRGGPQRDRKGLDPDGDGFACQWDPTPFRRAVQANTATGG